MQPQQFSPQQPGKRSKRMRWFFGLVAIFCYIVAVIAGAAPPHTSVIFGVFTTIAFLSLCLWIATFVDERRAKQAPPLPFQQKKHPTVADIYMEEALLRQAAQQAASEATLRQMNAVPDQMDSLMVVGVAIDPERYQQPSVLHQRVIQRERWTRVALAILAFFGGGGR
jgi:hypothetical protein